LPDLPKGVIGGLQFSSLTLVGDLTSALSRIYNPCRIAPVHAILFSFESVFLVDKIHLFYVFLFSDAGCDMRTYDLFRHRWIFHSSWWIWAGLRLPAHVEGEICFVEGGTWTCLLAFDRCLRTRCRPAMSRSEIRRNQSPRNRVYHERTSRK